MDIGTAKAVAEPRGTVRGTTQNIIQGIPHYMIDIVDPDENFTVQDFKKVAVNIIKDVQNRGKLPFLVGGTGLYISAIVDNLEIPEIPANKVLRDKLEKKSNEELFQDLKRVDPQITETIDRNNKRRLVRALEVTILSGRPFSSQRNKGKPLFDVLQIGLDVSRSELWQRIDERTEEQIDTGLEDEIRSLKNQYGCDIAPMKGFVYKEMCEYLEGKISLKEAIKQIKSQNKKYARRQLTWFKRDPRIHWISQNRQAEKLIKQFLKN